MTSARSYEHALGNMCMRCIVVWGFPTQTNLKENAAFNRNYSNSCKTRYGYYYRERFWSTVIYTEIKEHFNMPCRLFLLILEYHHLILNCLVKKYEWLEHLRFFHPLCHDLGVEKKGKGCHKWGYLPYFPICTTQVEYVRCKTSPGSITSEKYCERNIRIIEISQLAPILTGAKHLHL